MSEKKVRMELVGADGNAFAILGRFRKAAREQGWEPEEIDRVVKQATASDYDNLLRVIDSHVDDVGEEGEEEAAS